MKKLLKLNYKAKGFTLAEVLITLGIIGIVAEITIPTLMQDFQNQALIQNLKVTYSVLSQAFTQAAQDQGPVSYWDLYGRGDFNTTSGRNLLDVISPYLKITQSCRTTSGCLSPSYKQLNRSDDSWHISTDSHYPKVVLVNGAAVAFGNWDQCDVAGTLPALQNVCAEIYVDVNGLKAPNTYGKDFFVFYLTGDGHVEPVGLNGDGNYVFDTSCKDISTQDGWGCTGWVLVNQNMDYLKCNTLSWTGQKTCP